MTIVVSLLAALVALRPTATGTPAPIEWLMLGFPVAAICFAFLNYKAERAITNLRTFLSQLERLGDANLSLPSYNTDHKWSRSANKARRFHDYAAAVLVAGGNFIGLGAAQSIYPQRLSEQPVFWYVAAALALASFLIVLLSSRWSYSPQ